MGKILLLFVLVPLLETYLLTLIGGAIGWANTIALVIVTGVLGGWLARLEWGRAWRQWQRALAQGRMPDDGVLSGLLLLLGGALLITPGVVTDAVGLLLLVPPTRRAIADFLRPRLEERFFGGDGGNVRVIHFGGYEHAEGGDGETVIRRPLEPEERPRPTEGATIRRRPRAIIDADFEVSEPNDPMS